MLRTKDLFFTHFSQSLNTVQCIKSLTIKMKIIYCWFRLDWNSSEQRSFYWLACVGKSLCRYKKVIKFMDSVFETYRKLMLKISFALIYQIMKCELTYYFLMFCESCWVCYLILKIIKLMRCHPTLPNSCRYCNAGM